MRLQVTFNRTSMESKLYFGINIGNSTNSFNRTSMESKRVCSIGDDGVKMRLLIEPVWNRNTVKSFFGSVSYWAFNRTSMESKRVSFTVSAAVSAFCF